MLLCFCASSLPSPHSGLYTQSLVQYQNFFGHFLIFGQNNPNFCYPSYCQLSPLIWFCSPLGIFECKICPPCFPSLDWNDWCMCWPLGTLDTDCLYISSFCDKGPFLCVWYWKYLCYRLWCHLSPCINNFCEVLSGVNCWNSLGCPSCHLSALWYF